MMNTSVSKKIILPVLGVIVIIGIILGLIVFGSSEYYPKPKVEIISGGGVETEQPVMPTENNYQATKTYLEHEILQILKAKISPPGLESIGIAHTGGNYVLIYDTLRGKKFFKIYNPSTGAVYDVGYEKDLKDQKITITRYETLWNASEML